MLPDLQEWMLLITAAVVFLVTALIFLVVADVYLHRRPKRKISTKEWWGQGQ